MVVFEWLFRLSTGIWDKTAQESPHYPHVSCVCPDLYYEIQNSKVS